MYPSAKKGVVTVGRVERRMEKTREAPATPTGKAKIPMRKCFRCTAAGHYSGSSTAKLCERCGGRRYDSSKFASPANMDESPADAVLAIVGGPGDDAMETMSFYWYSSQIPAMGL